MNHWAPSVLGPFRRTVTWNYQDQEYLFDRYCESAEVKRTASRVALLDLREQFLRENEYFNDVVSIQIAMGSSGANVLSLRTFHKSTEGKELSQRWAKFIFLSYQSQPSQATRRHFFPILVAANEVRMNIELARLRTLRDSEAWDAINGGIWAASSGLRSCLLLAQELDPGYASLFGELVYDQLMSLRVRTELDVHNANTAFIVRKQSDLYFADLDRLIDEPS